MFFPPNFHISLPLFSLLFSHQNQPNITLHCETRIWNASPSLFGPSLGSWRPCFLQAWFNPWNTLFRLIAETLSPAHFRSGAPPGPQSFYNLCLINLGPRRVHKWCLPLCCSFHEFSEFSPSWSSWSSWGRHYLPFSEREQRLISKWSCELRRSHGEKGNRVHNIESAFLGLWAPALWVSEKIVMSKVLPDWGWESWM